MFLIKDIPDTPMVILMPYSCQLKESELCSSFYSGFIQTSGCFNNILRWTCSSLIRCSANSILNSLRQESVSVAVNWIVKF